MDSIEFLREFVGWCTVINLLVLIVASLVITAFKKPISKLHGDITELDKKTLDQAYFNYLANYKIAFLIFNLTPYVALRMLNL